MKKAVVAILVGVAVLSIFCSPLFGADFTPIFPKQFAPMVSTPNFTWAAGDYDLFCLYLYLPLPTGYQLFPVWRYKEPYFLLPDEAWEYLTMNGWVAWLVLGINIGTGDWNIIQWQYFQKVEDCVVEFPDPNLDAVIREEINKPEGDIMASELQELIHLRFPNRNISDLSGLEYLINLYQIWLENNQISDIRPLANLRNLSDLELFENQISDISPIAGLINLRMLFLWDNQISDINPLTGLTKLEDLDLFNNQISDISPLANLKNLWHLNLLHNTISDISPLANLTELGLLSLGNNQISDISPLSGLTQLYFLAIWGNHLNDISPLTGLVNLYGLELSYNNINDIFPLVQNYGIDTGDMIYLNDNPLNSDSCNDYIPTLEDRGVGVYHDCP